jgi:hypothetical protein
MFQRYVVSISYGCCKSRSECCIYCNSYTRMLQTSVPNVSSVFRCMLQVFFLDVAYVPHKYVASVLSRCRICLQWLSSVFQVFQICCKSFSCFGRILQVFRLNVAKVDMGLHMLQWDPPATATCSSSWVTAVGRRAGT